MSKAPNWDLLVGCNETDMIAVDENPAVKLNREVLPDFQRLQQDARKMGFEMQVISGYRSFERQLMIWNAKAKGLRPLFGNNGEQLDYDALSEPELLEAIMRWSALPSASRHHWGTDFDIIDAKAMPDGYQVQLTTAECVGDGYFAPMHDWLDEKIANDEAYGFFRPYDCDRGGVAPERWHLSYSPLSFYFEQAFSSETLKHWLASWADGAANGKALNANKGSEFLLLDLVLSQFEPLFDRYVTIPSHAYPLAFQLDNR